MNETESYEALRPRLQALGLDPQRVENVLNHGTPDVNYLNGWIENKYLAEWPKRADTPMDIGLRPEQQAWLYRRWIAGGPAWVMLRVASQYMLFSGFDAPALRRGLNQEATRALAVWSTAEKGRGDWGDLGNWLTWNSAAMTSIERARFLRLRAGWSQETVAHAMHVEIADVIDGETWCPKHANALIDFWKA